MIRKGYTRLNRVTKWLGMRNYKKWMSLDREHVTSRRLREFKQLWKMIWKVDVWPRIKIFLWTTARDIIPTRTRLASKGVEVGNGCYLCGAQNETIYHLFFECQNTKGGGEFTAYYTSKRSGTKWCLGLEPNAAKHNSIHAGPTAKLDWICSGVDLAMEKWNLAKQGSLATWPSYGPCPTCVY